MLRERDKSLRPICRIDWSVFRALSLVLIVVLTLPGGMIVNGISADTPKVQHTTALPGAAREDALIVSVQRDGKIFLGTDPTLAAQLPEKLRLGMARGAEKRVYIVADSRAKYGAVLEVVNAARAIGVERLSFVTFMPRTIRSSIY